ncbi:H(+)-transporting V1 sector ATPase subunit G [Geranomyces variabilis]|uniref:H(+)-transporting V1 sector ATPase subunit G n=1 Tax=Geranomyces variabilis TaxID=109894 RepID=A0AAD5XI43_9FUNG|nr:H(+)-transporting V1 sector ATPase subunit G [Geranomyces variabilis]
MALLCIIFTIAGSLYVLINAIRGGNYQTFSDRLPLYRCVADLMFAAVHTIDHLVLLGTQEYPSQAVGRLLSSLVLIFVSYQMLVTTVLAVQSFLKVTFDVTLPLGSYEHRLHLLAFFPPLVIFGIGNGVDALGPFYYFQGLNANNHQGMIYGWFVVTSYTTIRTVNNVAFQIKGAAPSKNGAKGAASGKSASVARAVNRLHSFMIAACLQWIPAALLIGACTSFESTSNYGGKIFLQYLGIMGANLGGVFNSAAYVYNERAFKRSVGPEKSQDSGGTRSTSKAGASTKVLPQTGSQTGPMASVGKKSVKSLRVQLDEPAHIQDDRTQRLKDARSEAQKDIEALKAAKNKEFADYEKQYAGSSDDTVAKANASTEEELKGVNVLYAKNKQQVIEKLLGGIVNVQPKIHPNAKKARPAA